jgi:hypothetical protein
MAVKGRVAAPLLGGVRGWVYLKATRDMRITARETRAIEGVVSRSIRIKLGNGVRESTVMR